MTKLKLGPIADDKPVKVTVELPAPLHRDLVAYAEVLARETGQPVIDPARLIVPMLERFISTDRGFAKARRLDRAALSNLLAGGPKVFAFTHVSNVLGTKNPVTELVAEAATPKGYVVAEDAAA